MSTTANAPSPSADTTTFLVSRRLCTKVWVSNSSCHPRRQRSALKRPHTITHVIGSCDWAVGGQGQTMAGGEQDPRRPRPRGPPALLSRVTLSPIWSPAGLTRGEAPPRTPPPLLSVRRPHSAYPGRATRTG